MAVDGGLPEGDGPTQGPQESHGPCGDGFLVRQAAYFTELLALHAAGLPAFDAVQLARAWSQGACVHLQRALPMSAAWAAAVDAGGGSL